MTLGDLVSFSGRVEDESARFEPYAGCCCVKLMKHLAWTNHFF
jgi:hypothetical protein